MVMKYFVFVIAVLLSPVGIVAETMTVQEDAAQLTVWIRAGGDVVKSEISSFIRQISDKLPQAITSKILVVQMKMIRSWMNWLM